MKNPFHDMFNNPFKNWGVRIPFYVTRKDSAGNIGQYEAGIGLILIIQTLVIVNILLWGSYGVIRGVANIIHLF